MNKKVAAVALGVTGVAAATVLSGGLYANTIVEVKDITNTAVGAGDADSVCETAMTIKAGLARYDQSVRNFVVNDVTISDINVSCAGLNATVVGIDSAGVPVVEGSGTSASPSFTLTLSNGITLDSVSEWRVVIQDNSGDAGTNVAPPSLVGNPVPTVESDVESLPTVIPDDVELEPESTLAPEDSLEPTLQPTVPAETLEPDVTTEPEVVTSPVGVAVEDDPTVN